MKQLSKILCVVLAFIFASCSSDNDGDGVVTAGDGAITAKVDGITVTSIPMATFAYITEAGLQITGSASGAENLAIQILTFDVVGKYDMGGNNTIAIGTYTEIDLNNPQNLDNVYFAPCTENGVDGFVDVTEFTGTSVKGTFSFKAKNETGTMKDVTNGSFTVPTTFL